jgi:membrane-bound lytic murein transglycosylase B
MTLRFHWRAAVTAIALCAGSHAIAGDFSKYDELNDMIESLEAQKIYAPGELAKIFEEVSRQDRILELIARPAEKSREWKDYRPIFIQSSRVDAGIDFWEEYQEPLARAEAQFGVPASMILAILGVETKFGGNKGGYKVIESLSTLGFDYPPRAKFFRNELREFLILAKQNGINPLETKGSYAGAMGFPQFMPSSWRRLAIDFDGDGRIDLIDNPVDAIGSIANYFKANGWQTNEVVAVRAAITGDNYDDATSTELKTTSTLAALAKAGITPRQKQYFPDKTPASGLRLQGENGGEFWIGFNNFFVITRYNRSILYAMATFQLAEEIKAAHDKKTAGNTTLTSAVSLLP